MAAMTVATFALAVPAIAVSAFDHGGRASSAIVAAWARLVLRLAGVSVRVIGAENLPADGAVIFLSTHQSMMDVPALFQVVPARTRFVAKRGLFAIPLFGWAIRLLGFVPIDRGDTRAARRALDRASQLARHDRPVLVFPEGTRSPEGQLLPFKKGAFALALDAHLPVVPLACLGGRRCLAPGGVRVVPGVMTVRVGAPLPPDHPAFETRATLLAEVRQRMEALVAQGEPDAPPAPAAP